MKIIKIKHYQHSALHNFISSILVTLSPRVPKAKRRTYKQIKQTNKQQQRDAKLLRVLAQ